MLYVAIVALKKFFFFNIWWGVKNKEYYTVLWSINTKSTFILYGSGNNKNWWGIIVLYHLCNAGKSFHHLILCILTCIIWIWSSFLLVGSIKPRWSVRTCDNNNTNNLQQWVSAFEIGILRKEKAIYVGLSKRKTINLDD